MRKGPDGKIIFSPSDLTTYLESPFASFMNRLEKENPKGKTWAEFERDAPDESQAALAKNGLLHEAAVLAELEKEFGKATHIPGDGFFETRQGATLSAMDQGAPLIFQAALGSGNFQGYADFLVKRLGKSKLGDYFYEAWDSKLAHRAKPSAVIQLCAYSEMLDAIQGLRPKNLTVVLGKNEKSADGVSRLIRSTHRVEDYFFYYLSLKESFLKSQEEFDPKHMPFPSKSENVRDWSTVAERLRNERDHLSNVANITDLQIKKLESAGVTTLTALAKSKRPSIDKLDGATYEKLKHQASLQLKSRGKARPEFEVLPHDTTVRRGLTLLPPPSPSDIFFDMEGFPLIEGGLEYLFGAVVLEKGKPVFNDWWAHSRLEEKKAFQSFIDWAHSRWKKYPTLHIYHYAAYEVTAMRKLMTSHATREEEVDDLLRHEVFVDLYTVVSQGIRIGEPKYSLKNVEHIYSEKRQGEVTNAGDSIVQYGNWIESPDGPTWRESKVLKDIRDYNEVDCQSTLGLAKFLWSLQKESGLAYASPAQSDERDEDETPRERTAASLLAEEIAKTLPQSSGEDFAAMDGDSRTKLFFSHILQYHKREAKPFWWAYFDRLGMTPEELIEDSECLGGLKRTKAGPRKEKQSQLFDYEFDPAQETKLREGSHCVCHTRPDVTLEIFSIDSEEGKLTLKVGPKALSKLGRMPNPLALIPSDYVRTEVIENSILESTQAWKAKAYAPKLLAGSLSDFLHRRPPHFSGRKRGEPVIEDEAKLLEGSVGAIRRLKESSLCIQGPPGTGKTYTAARMIVQLVKDKKKVGISSNSHKAIQNLLEAVSAAAKEQKTPWVGVKIGGEEDAAFTKATGVNYCDKKSLPPDFQVVGGTAWAFSAPELKDQLSHLFIDEAGQVSVANLIGMAQATENLVLMGDQMQLEQPMKGVHPGETGQSSLTYLLQDHATIPQELGIFLGVTRRMHPDVCQFISDSIYDGRLKSHPDTLKRAIILSKTKALITKPSGILYVPVPHEANSQESEEEALVILKLVKELMKGKIEEKGKNRPVTEADILVVAPYNLQVMRLKKCLPEGIAVGTVDKFQGQEAFISILSMCSSSGDASPRGAEFLFNPNRLNVAISRAKVLSIVVGAPSLAQTRCSNLENMKRVNLYCKVVRVGLAVPASTH